MFERFLTGLTLAQVTDAAPKVADAAQKTASAAQGSPWILFLLLIGVIVIPFVLGTLISRALRMKDVSMRLGIVLFALFLAVTPFAYRLVQGHGLKDALR